MNNAVKPSEIISEDIARILADCRNLFQAAAGRICAARINVAIQADHLVPCLSQHRRKNRANVAQVSSNQNAHGVSPYFAFGNMKRVSSSRQLTCSQVPLEE